VLHSPDSPDLALSDFYIFDTIKQRLRGSHGQSFDDLKQNIQAILDIIPLEEIFANFWD
jgi:hypothetical protein